jgi:hypothetical protein
MRALPLCLLTLGVLVWPSAVAADPIRISLDARNTEADVLLTVGRDHPVLRDRHEAQDELAASVTLARGDVSGLGAATLSSNVTGHQISGMGQCQPQRRCFHLQTPFAMP